MMTLSGAYLDVNRRVKPNDSARSNIASVEKASENSVGNGALPNAPTGRHNAHHAFDLITLNARAFPAIPYMVAAAIARALLGVYPVGLLVFCSWWGRQHQCTEDTLSDIIGGHEGRGGEREEAVVTTKPALPSVHIQIHRTG